MRAQAPTPNPDQQDIHTLTALLRVDPAHGLSSDESARRLEQDGLNILRVDPPTPAWRLWWSQLHDPLIYLLLAALSVMILLWWVEGAAGWPIDAVVILVIVVLNAVLGFVQEFRSQAAAAALSRLTAMTSEVLRDGLRLRVPSAELVQGDVLLLSEGDSVGADARLLQAHALHIQEASLTGESEAVLKGARTLDEDAPLAERFNMVFKGTAVVKGTGMAVVTATGMATEMGRIAHLLASTPEQITPLQKEVREIGRTLGMAVLLIASLVVVTVLWMRGVQSLADLEAVLLLGVSLAVAAVPEGLPAILSLVLAIGVQRMAKRQAIVKKLSSVETLGSASVICTDKTGTLTRSQMAIEKVLTASGCSLPEGQGYDPSGQIRHEGLVVSAGPLHSELVLMLSGGSLAGNADLRQDADGNWVIHGDPTEAAFLVAERKLGAHAQRHARFERIAEIPFTSERKRMSVLAIDHEHPNQRMIIVKGAPDVLLQRCSRARVGMDVVAMSDEIRARAHADVDDLSDAALRTLSVAYRPLRDDEQPDMGEALEQDLIFVGTVGIIDPPRPEVAPAIQEAQRAGIRVVMITGDHPRTAARIAADLGIIEAGGATLTGLQIDALDEAGLAEAVSKTSVYARVDPSHKLRIVDALKAQGHVVAMTGDGVNDAPALKSADIGVAMGITGTEVTKEAGKMILADDNFATIVAAVREGRGILDNIRKFLRYLLSSNMGEVLTVFLAVIGAHWIGLTDAAGNMVLPLLATQILWINLITDSGPALAMGVDPHGDDVMGCRPRRPDERVIDARMWSGVVQIGLVMALSCLFTLDLFLPGGMIEGAASLETARTAAFTVLVLAQLFNAFNARSESASAWQGCGANLWLWAAVVLAVVLQVAVVSLPILNHAFGTQPLNAWQWLQCVLIAGSVLVYSECRKWVIRRRGSSSDHAQ